MGRDRELRFSTLISIVFIILIVDTDRVETRGSCHYFSLVKKNWATALDICMGMSMCLADFDTYKHFKILSSLDLANSEYWFGLNKQFTPNWTYVTSHHKIRYLPLNSRLNEDHHKCGVIRTSQNKHFSIEAGPCEEEKMFVCAQSVFCKRKREYSQFSSGYHSLPRHDGNVRRRTIGCRR